MTMNDPQEHPGTRRSAIILMALGEDRAAEVFKHLSPQEIHKLSLSMSSINHISQEEMRRALLAFHNESEEFVGFDLGSDDYLRSVLTKAMGSERASTLIEDVMDTRGPGAGIESLNLMEPSMVVEMIRDEHPQIIATTLVHLERHQAANIIGLLEEETRNDVMLRIATFSGVQPEALQELTEVLTGMLDGKNLKRTKMGGTRTAAEILNLLASGMETTAIDSLRDHSEDLAQTIIDQMFLFENIADLDARSIQMILKDVDSNSLALALKGADERLLDAITNNMSQRAADLMFEDMETRGPVRVSQVEAEQKAILQIVRGLADDGEIILMGGDEDYV